MKKKILLLDDSDLLRKELVELLLKWGYDPKDAATPAEAELCVESGVDFAIVDVYLDGGRGAELSEEFINKVIHPQAIPYGRLTSAPESVPEYQRGLFVLDKHLVRYRPSLLRDTLIGVCE
jgi:DNA-binding NtrC family response regulator